MYPNLKISNLSRSQTSRDSSCSSALVAVDASEATNFASGKAQRAFYGWLVQAARLQLTGFSGLQATSEPHKSSRTGPLKLQAREDMGRQCRELKQEWIRMVSCIATDRNHTATAARSHWDVAAFVKTPMATTETSCDQTTSLWRWRSQDSNAAPKQ